MKMVSFFNFNLKDFLPFHELRYKRQIFASAAAASGMLSVGAILGWTSAALPSLKEQAFPLLRSDQESWIASIVPLAALIAGPIFGISVDRFGRKPTMIITGLIAIFGWFMIAFSTSVEHIYAGRFITGLATGSCVVTIPVYVSDITEKEIRGALSLVVQICTGIGVLLSFLIGSMVNWQWSAFLSTGFTFLFLALILFIPESPRYYLDNMADDAAADVLAWLRGTDAIEDVKNELHAMAATLAEVKSQTRSFKQLILSKRIRLPLLTCVIIMTLQQLTGYNAMMMYLVEILHESGSTHEYFSSILIAIVVVITMCVATTLMDTIGRKPLLIFSATFVTITQFITGAYLFLKAHGYNMDIFMWLPLSNFLVFFATYSIGLGPVPFVIMSEILPNHVIGFASGLTISTHFTFAFLVTRYFNGLSAAIGMAWTFWFCSFWALLATFFIIYFIPETKLKSLEEIQEFYREKIPTFGGLLDTEEGDGDEDGGVFGGSDGTESANYNTFDDCKASTTATASGTPETEF